MPGFTIKKSAPSATSRSCQNVKIFSQLNFNKEHNRILDHLYQCFLMQKNCLSKFFLLGKVLTYHCSFSQANGTWRELVASAITKSWCTFCSIAVQEKNAK